MTFYAVEYRIWFHLLVPEASCLTHGFSDHKTNSQPLINLNQMRNSTETNTYLPFI